MTAEDEFVYRTGRPPYLPTDWHVLSDGSKHRLGDCDHQWCGWNPVAPATPYTEQETTK